MTNVKIDGRSVRLDTKNVIGVGGEATIFKHQNKAVKVYLNSSKQRDRKLRALLPHVKSLPDEVVAPLELVMDGSARQAVGFTMRLLDANYIEARQLSVKKFRAQTGLTTHDIVQLFLNTHRTLRQIHQSGMVVGDFNDLNLMFKGSDMLFIDVDSFQFDQFPCVVGTEAFLDPQLYNKDLSADTYFTTDNDWYAYAVLLFKSLLLTHPYGGVHPSVNLLTMRAMQGISVFDSAVKYPRIAYSPDLLSDELAHLFDEWFTHGKRDIFPENLLHDYAANAKVCPNCGATYPHNRARCPMCSTVVPVVVPDKVQFETLLQTGEEGIAWNLQGQTLRVLTHENGKVVLHEVDKYRQTRRVVLFNTMPNATYAFLENMLVISPARDSETLMIVDISGDQPKPILQTTTSSFGGTQPMFGTSARHLYRLAGGYLMRGHIDYGELIEQSILSISEGQTWFHVDPSSDRVFGYYRVFNDYNHWLLLDRQHVEVDVAPLEPGEFQIDIDVQFGKNSVLILRQTQLNGVERVRIDEINLKGERLMAVVAKDAADLTPIHGHAYSQNVLLQATDAGIVQTRLDTMAVKTFSQTEPVVKRGNIIHAYDKGLLMMEEKRATYLTL